MCGIVAYIGDKKAKPILMDGLKRLEYRGYDSAGLAVFSNKKIHFSKKKGRIKDLENHIDIDFPEGDSGIAHTRWATHGEPSDVNAHPHYSDSQKLFVVHNGIIENHEELKEKLKEKGYTLVSETDTEVLGHLIEEELKGTDSLFEAVRKSLTQVYGTYGIAVMSQDHPEEIIAAKNGSPLIVGVGDDEHFIASDVSALLPYTKRVVYPKDGEIVKITKEEFETRSIKSKETTESTVEKVEWNTEMASKKGYDHFMLKEMFEQPQVIKNATAGRIILEEGTAHLGGLNYTPEELRDINRIVLCGMGAAYLSALEGKYIIEELTGIPVDVENASELRYKKILLDEKTLFIVVSQSGETADTIAAMREIQRKGQKVLGISNVVGSTIARETDGGMFMHAGPEIGVASTKAFIAQLTMMVLLGLKIGRHKDLDLEDGKEVIEHLLKIPAQIESVLEQSEQIKDVAEEYKNAKNFLYLGRKFSYPIAEEGALKLKEISYIHAEAYPAGEMKHGPIALIDENFPSFFIAPKDSVYEKTLSNMQEVKARKGGIIAVTTKGDTEIRKITDDIIEIPETIELLQSLLTLVVVQLFAYHIAVLNNKDVDKPRNLAKSVTVE